MPLVRIDYSQATRGADATRIGDGVHQALVDATDIPSGDRFQILNPHSVDQLSFDREYMSIAREDVVYIQITLVGGRSEAQKRQLYRAIVENVASAGVRPQDVFITLTENTRADWSVGNGAAQLLELTTASARGTGTAGDSQADPGGQQ